MSGLFDKSMDKMDNISEIYNRMKANCPDPDSNSTKLWELRRSCTIDPCEKKRLEIMLEKAVAMLAVRGHMPGWFNQCPTASGITNSSISRQDSSATNTRSSIDLVKFNEEKKEARLVELKWGSNDPPSAIRQILRYGAAYIFCRVHKGKLTFPAESLIEKNVHYISLEVVAPHRYYLGFDERDHIAQINTSLDEFAASKINGLSMSLDVLAFPEDFDKVPFCNGEQVKEKCNNPQLTEEGRSILDAFNNLVQVWPTS